MIGSIIINMPLKSYLVKFLTKKYGTQHKVSLHSTLGIYLSDLLDKQYRKETKIIKGKSFYPFMVPKTMVEKNGFTICGSKMKRFETFMQKLFLSSLDDYITTTCSSNLVIQRDEKQYKQDVLNAMKQFLACYQVTEDEIKLDSLYRNYKRDKQKIGQTLET